MQGRPQEDVFPYLSSVEQQVFKDQKSFFIWGCQPSLENRWRVMEENDYILFYARGKFIAAGELQFKKKSVALAQSLWPVSKNTHEPWSCVFFVKNLANISLPIGDFCALTGYKMDRVQGFMRVSTGLDKIIHQYGSPDSYIESLKTGLSNSDIRELSALSEKTHSKLNPEETARLDELTRGKRDEEIEKALTNYAKNALNMSPEQVVKQVKTYKRNRSLVNNLKEKYKSKCQICGFTFKTTSGSYYSEAAHIIPISSGKKGIDTPDNIWILCPNHHKMLDFGALTVVSINTYLESGKVKSLLI